MLNTNEVRIETSTVCNHRCLFCPHATKFKRKKEIMSFKMFRFLLDKIKDQAPNITDVTISGFGEAFTDPTIIKKIRYAHQLGYNVHMLTNGSFLKKDEIDILLNLPLVDFRISLHSLNSDTWSFITGGNPKNHQALLDHIDYIIANRSDKTKIIITVDVIDANMDEVGHIIDRYSDTVDLLEIWKPHNWVNTYNYRNGQTIKTSCGRPLNSPLQVQVDGTVNMCCFDFNGELLLGDLKHQSIEDIFNSKEYLELKKAHLDGTLDCSDYICKDCDQRKTQEGIVIYNNSFNGNDRIGRTSTTLTKVDI
jgi:radical SAM protein with 4Fe4S-binding SPASM domain